MSSQRPWTDEELQLLREFYPQVGPVGVSLLPQLDGRSRGAIASKAFSLGVRYRTGWACKLEKPAQQAAPRGRKKPRDDHRDLARAAREKASRRPCLRCTQPFLSEGPHHRLCERCRGQSVPPEMVLHL